MYTRKNKEPYWWEKYLAYVGSKGIGQWWWRALMDKGYARSILYRKWARHTEFASCSYLHFA